MTERYRYILTYLTADGRSHRSTHNLEGLIREVRRVVRRELLRRAEIATQDIAELVLDYGVEPGDGGARRGS